MPVALPLLGAIDLLTLLAWIVCLGLALVWRHTIGAGLLWLADELDKAAVHLPWPVGTVHIFGPLSSLLRTVAENVEHWLGQAALATEHATLFLWNHMVSITEEVARWIEAQSLAELHAWESLFTTTLPNLFHTVSRHVESLIASASHELHKAYSELSRFVGHEIHRVEAYVEHIVHRAEAVIEGLALPRIRTIEHDLGALKDRLDRIAKSLSKDAIIALIGATIWKELFNGIKCSSWGNLVNKRGCGAWQGLEDVLGLLVDAVLIGSICEILPFLTTAVDDVGLGLVATIHASGLTLCAGTYPPPPPMPAVALLHPTVYGTTLTLAG